MKRFSTMLLLPVSIAMLFSGCDYQARALMDVKSTTDSLSVENSDSRIQATSNDISNIEPLPPSSEEVLAKESDKQRIADKLLREFLFYADLHSAMPYREGISSKELEIVTYFLAIATDKASGLLGVYRDCLSESDLKTVISKGDELRASPAGIYCGYTSDGLHVTALEIHRANSYYYSRASVSIIRDEPYEVALLYNAWDHDLMLCDVRVDDLSSTTRSEPVDLQTTFFRYPEQTEYATLDHESISDEARSYIEGCGRRISSNGEVQLGDWNLFATEASYLSPDGYPNSIRININGEEVELQDGFPNVKTE